VTGWAFAKAASDLRVRILVDGAVLREVSPSLPRPDVRDHFQDSSIPEACGFEAQLFAHELPNQDQVVVSVECVSASGSRKLGDVPVRRLTTAQPTVPRSDYRTVWDEVSKSADQARIAACGTRDLTEFDKSGQETAETVRNVTSICPSDIVLEIGCGPGRVGTKLAPHCKHWIGGDVSNNMLDHARENLRHLSNISFRRLSGYDLAGFEDNSLDVTYCTGVFMHLDEWERYRYISDMYRVLKPGGRAYVDNVNLLGEQGWRFFLDHCRIEPANRPPNISKTSTPDELRTYFERSGFADIAITPGSNWIVASGRKL
jgi:ubiquinone/menaquinone biosynthesis C-methylase UbiE